MRYFFNCPYKESLCGIVFENVNKMNSKFSFTATIKNGWLFEIVWIVLKICQRIQCRTIHLYAGFDNDIFLQYILFSMDFQNTYRQKSPKRKSIHLNTYQLRFRLRLRQNFWNISLQRDLFCFIVQFMKKIMLIHIVRNCFNYLDVIILFREYFIRVTGHPIYT